MKLQDLLSRNNLKGMNKNIFYCGLNRFNNIRSKFLNFIGLFKSLFGINEACFIHDKMYYYIFKNSNKIRTLLFYKFIADVFFLINMIKYLSQNNESYIKRTNRMIIAVIFFLIVILFTPFYIKLYYKK